MVSRTGELSLLILSSAIRFFADAIVGIYIPLYLLSLQFPIERIILFFFFYSLVQFVFTPLSAKLSSLLGYKKLMVISIIPQLLFYLSLFLLEVDPSLFYPVAALRGISFALFWVPFHAYFALSGTEERRGTEYATFSIFALLSAIPGPIVGAFLIVSYGFGAIFAATMLFLTLSAIPLLLTPDIVTPVKFSLRKALSRFRRGIFVALFGRAMNDNIQFVLWPIFMFLAIGSYLEFGWINSVGAAVFIVSSWAAGNIFDKRQGERAFILSAKLAGLLWVFRMYLRTFMQFLVLEVVYRVPDTVRATTLEALFYDSSAKSKDAVQFTVIRELSLHLGFMCCGLLTYVVYTSTSDLALTFLLASAGCAIQLFAKKDFPG